jgi:hypothetical protein
MTPVRSAPRSLDEDSKEKGLDIEPLTLIGGCAVAILVVGWLVVSFSAPGGRRTVIEWLSACAMYTALLMLFLHLSRRASESDNTFALVAFGFLAVLFGGGLLVTLYRTLAATRGASGTGPSATN